MEAIDRPTIQRAAVDLVDEVKLRSAQGAAEKLAHYGGAEVAAALIRLSPGFAQDVLASLPPETRERAMAAAPDEYSRQWQRNALDGAASSGRVLDLV